MSLTAPSGTWTRYDDPQTGLAFEHPCDWLVSRGRAGLIVSVRGPAGRLLPSDLSIVRRANDKTIDLDDLARSAIAELHRVLSYVILLDVEAVVVAGSPARRLLFTYRQGALGLTGEQWLLVDRTHIWTVTAGVPNENYPAVARAWDRVVGSLSLPSDGS